MRKGLAIGITIAVIGVAIWIFTIIAGGGPQEETPRFGESYNADSTRNKKNLEKTNEKKISTNESNTTNKTSSSDLTVVDLGINTSTETYNLPGATDTEAINTTLTKLMYIHNGIWDVFGHNLFETDFPTFLEDKKIEDFENTEVTYTQRFGFPTNITLRNFTSTYFRDGNHTVGFNLTAKKPLLEYDISLNKKIPLEDFKEEYITILGKQYYVREASGTKGKLHLLENPYTFKLTGNEKYLINYPGETSLLITINLLEEKGVYLKIDNTTSKRLTTGEVFLYENMTVTIKEILYDKKRDGHVTIVLSPRELTLEDGKTIRDGETSIENLRFDIHPQGSNTISGFNITWEPREKTFITNNKSITMPLFENIKIAMSDWAYYDTDLEADPYVYVYLTARKAELLELNNNYYAPKK